MEENLITVSYLSKLIDEYEIRTGFKPNTLQINFKNLYLLINEITKEKDVDLLEIMGLKIIKTNSLYFNEVILSKK